MKVLAVGAHPDDLEIQCSGTLLRFAGAGHEVVMCHATDGELGGYADGADVAATRVAEARAAAELVGAGHARLGIPDAALSASDEDQVRKLVELVREVGPDVVLTHSPDDYHDDHNAVSAMVGDATLKASIPLYDAEGAHLDHIPPVYFMETLFGLSFEPREFVDISPVFARKREVVLAHGSQVSYLRDHYGLDLLHQMEVTARFRGHQCGTEFAEAFAPLMRWPRIRPHRVLP